MNYPSWECAVTKMQGDPSWTVGSLFLLSCQGEETSLDQARLTIKNPEGRPHFLKIIEVKSLNLNEVQMVVTSYEVGGHARDQVQLTDQESSVDLLVPAFTIESVLSQAEDQKPYAPREAMTLSAPTALWVVLGIGALVLAAIISLRLRRAFQRRQLIESLKAHQTALSPFEQFHKELRSLQRSTSATLTEGTHLESFVKKLDELLRLFLVRELQIPALQWNARQISGEIRKQDPKLHRRVKNDLKLFFREIEKAHYANQKGEFQVNDCGQLIQICQRTTESIWKLRRVESI